MPIKVKCGSCSASFSAKDNLAGKTVKCPKCGAGIRVPGGGQQGNPSRATATAGAGAGAVAGHAGTVKGNLGDPLAELLDEVGVKGVQTGPSCPACDVPVTPGARICINCGFNFETGQQLQTLAYDDENDEMSGMSETEKMLWRAEREIDDMPISGEGQDFGDGASSFAVAGLVGLIAILLAATGLLLTASLQKMADDQGSEKMALVASAIFFLIAHVWMIISAFTNDPKYGVMCVFVPGFSFVYACMYRVWFAVFMMLAGLLVFFGTLTYMYYMT